jgi:hypothetical protein
VLERHHRNLSCRGALTEVRLSRGDYEGVLNVARAAAEARDQVEFSRVAVKELATLVPADQVVLNEVEPCNPSDDHLGTHSLSHCEAAGTIVDFSIFIPGDSLYSRSCHPGHERRIFLVPMPPS